MKKLLKLLAALLLLMIILVLYTMVTTGTFRSIEGSYSGTITEIDIIGAEDFSIDREAGMTRIILKPY